MQSSRQASTEINVDISLLERFMLRSHAADSQVYNIVSTSYALCPMQKYIKMKATFYELVIWWN